MLKKLLNSYSGLTVSKLLWQLGSHQFPVQPHVVQGELSIASNVDRLRRLDDDGLHVAVGSPAAAVQQVRQVDAELDAEDERSVTRVVGSNRKARYSSNYDGAILKPSYSNFTSKSRRPN